MKALIIENDPEIAEHVCLAFKMGLPEVKLAPVHLGSEVPEMVEKESPDLIIIDAGLPDLDVVKIIDQIRCLSKAPIMVVTASARGVDVIKELKLRSDECVLRPFKQEDFLARVNNLIRRRK